VGVEKKDMKTSDIILAVGGGIAGAWLLSQLFGGNRTLFVIPLENRGYGQVIGSSSMPFFNQLAQQNTLCTNYHSNLHPSLPNYLVMTSGQDWGIADDNYHLIPGTDNVFAQLDASGVLWRAYGESMPSPCSTTDTDMYASRHVPAVYYASVVSSGNCSTNVTDWNSGQTELSGGVIPRFAMITPNLMNDAHDGTLAQCDAWLLANVPLLMALPGFVSGGAIVITWDETEGGTDTQIATVVIRAGGGSRQDATLYDHRSLCATIEDFCGVGRLAATSGVPSLL
jgi:phosphatidylinositol-3-phosphatase